MAQVPLTTLVRLNARLWRAKASSLHQQSTFMLTVIWVFVGAYWVFGFQLFYEGLHYVAAIPAIGRWLLERLLYLFFAFLLMMLFFSNVIIGYASLFRNQETQWLLGLPIPFADILRWKLLETMLLASWAFAFLSGPLLLAYGMVQQFPWLFYVKAVLLYVPFLVLPAAAAALVTLLLARFMTRRMFKAAVVVGGLLLLSGAAVVMVISRQNAIDSAQLNEQFDRIMSRTEFSTHPFWPSAWLVKSLLEDYWKFSLFFAGVLVSNALMLGLIVYSASGKMFYAAWSRVASHGSARWGWFEIAGRALFRGADRALHFLPWLSAPMRSLVLKDVRTFFRDTVQWSQFAIFFGLLGMYVLNLRHASDRIATPLWTNLVSFLNLTACAMTLATLTTRFVFPQFSLEGKRLWILGLAPVGMRKVLIEKFLLSSFGSIAITLTLMLISSLMLQLESVLVVMFCGTVVLMGFALSGLAVGLGALYPNFRDDNPSKIVSGFGGTFCLVMSMTYVTACIGAEAFSMHYSFRLNPALVMQKLTPAAFLLQMMPVLGVVLVGSLTVTWLPLYLAFRRLDHLEI